MIINITATDQLHCDNVLIIQLVPEKSLLCQAHGFQSERRLKKMTLSFNASHNCVDIIVICVRFQKNPTFKKPRVGVLTISIGINRLRV